MLNALVFLLGASLTLSFAPFNYWLLLYPVLITWLVINAKYTKKPFLTGWCFGFGLFGAGISWVHVSIATFGGLPLIASIFLMVLLCGYLALFPATLMYLLKRFIPLRLWPLAMPFAWLIIEWCRANFLTGFPWLSIGYSQIDSPFYYLIPVIGEIGLSAIIIALCSSIAIAIAIKEFKYPITSSAVVTCILIVSMFLGPVFSVTESKTVSLVQGNIEQSIKWRPEQDRPTVEKYKKLTEDLWGSDLIVWPEAAIPTLESLPIGFETLAELDQKAEDNNTAIVTGAVDFNYRSDESYNYMLSLGIDENGNNTMPYTYLHANRYAKHQLLPIGEFVPFESLLRPLAPIFDLPMSSFSRGEYVQNNLIANGMHLVSAICYEIVFPAQIKANIQENSDMILTISNDAWFGDSHGPHQHLQIARMRAIEFGLPVIRATNNGVTAAYDAKGKLLGELPQFVADSLTVRVDLVEGSTFYQRHGASPIYLFFATLFAVAIFIAIRKPE